MTATPTAALALRCVRAGLLATTAPDTPSATLVPNPRPDTFIRVDTTAPIRETLVSRRALVAVQVWAPTEARAAMMAEELADALESAAYEAAPTVLGWAPGLDPHSWPDPDDPHACRWQFTATLTHSLV